MSRRLVGECVAGIPVVLSVFVPYALFEMLVTPLCGSPEFQIASELTLLALTSLLVGAALHYAAWRIRVLLASEG